MKNYSQQLIQQLQDCINAGTVQIETYKDYSFLKTFNSSGINMCFYFDKSLNRPDCVLKLTPEMDKKFISQWCAETVAGKFMISDYKKDARDFIGNTLYHKVCFNIAGKPFKALVRLLNEITGGISEKKKADLIMNFGDLTIDNKVFSIVKIIQDNGIGNWGQEDVLSHIQAEKKKEYESAIIEEAITQPEDDKEDENLMAPLF